MSDPITPGESATILGVSVGIFLLISLVFFAIDIWALVALIQKWDRLSGFARLLGVIFLFFFPPMTLIIAYVAEEPVSKGHVSEGHIKSSH